MLDTAVLLLLEQPFHTLDGIVHKLSTGFHLRRDTPEAVWLSWVDIHLGLDTVFLSHDTLEDQCFISERVETAYLEVGRWQ